MNDYGYSMAARSYEALKELDGDSSECEPESYCDACGAPLYSGDECYRIGSEFYCENCCHMEVIE